MLKTKLEEGEENKKDESTLLTEDTPQPTVSHKKKVKMPFYLLSPESPYSIFEKSMLDIIAGPTVIMNLYFIAFNYDEKTEFIWFFMIWCELLYLVEIVRQFFTTYTDPETFKIVINLRDIAVNYITKGSFFQDMIAFLPYWILFISDPDEDRQALRNILWLKVIRINRIGQELIKDAFVHGLLRSLYEPDSRIER
jgi:hypothetical protein